jgi:hypothetical protein
MKKQNIALCFLVALFGVFLYIATVPRVLGDAQGGNTTSPPDWGKTTVISSIVPPFPIPGLVLLSGSTYKLYTTGSTGIILTRTSGTTATVGAF